MAPDYELAAEVFADSPAQIRSVADPLRSQVLSLVLERAATVSELAEALDRPKSTMAYHVDQLVEHGLLKVVRTRKVRAIDERFYGRVARTIVIGDGPLAKGVRSRRFLFEAEAEAVETADDQMQSTIRHARIPKDRAHEFFDRIVAMAEEFVAQPRAGDVVYGFVAAVYPTRHPTLPAPKEHPTLPIPDEHAAHPAPEGSNR